MPDLTRIAKIAVAGLIGVLLAMPARAGLVLSSVDVNAASLEAPHGDEPSAGVLKAQILLDRARFSPGAIDGMRSENFTRALAAFQRFHSLPAGALDPATWGKLNVFAKEPVLIDYAISAEDVKGPFVASIPDDFEKMAELKWLGYRSPRELLAEKFHMDQGLLGLLNPGQSFDQVGARVVVANVERKPQNQRVILVEVSKADRSIRAFNAQGDLVAVYPASVGSGDNPSPHGVYRVRNAAANPIYYYKPSLMLAGVTVSRPLKLPRGPNNPVGAMWIGLDKPTFGIHGTPEPEKVGSAFSHGCVRLTNWDAIALARMVRPGTLVAFLD